MKNFSIQARNMPTTLFLISILLLATPLSGAADSTLEWGALNPARGEKGPKAANLWGDRRKSGASGFLVKFVDGFSSPPHIHNVSYRGVVIAGLIHNDDPNAEKMWMPAGSYWTQPAGESHITSAKGENNLIYVEIQEGPYLVHPSAEASDNGERPINVHKGNIVWLEATEEVKIAYLWGDPEGEKPSGKLLRIPAGVAVQIRSPNSALRGVVIEGRADYQEKGKTSSQSLKPGGYFSSTDESRKEFSLKARAESLVYVRTIGRLSVVEETSH